MLFLLFILLKKKSLRKGVKRTQNTHRDNCYTQFFILGFKYFECVNLSLFIPFLRLFLFLFKG